MRDEGYTLLEVVIAFMLLSLALSAIVSRLGIAVNALNHANETISVSDAAANILAELGHSRALAYGLSEGDLANGMHWRLRILPLRERPPGVLLPRLEAHDVSLTMTWHERNIMRSANYTTIRLGIEQ